MVDDADGVGLGDTLGAPVPVPAKSSSQPTLAVGPPLYDAPIRFDLAPTARYRLGHLVARGGMGEVRVAFDDQLGREVAVKRIRGEAEPTPDQIARFVREARVQGWLEHPAVVPVHDIAVDADGRPFFVMKRLAGTEMSELLDRMRSGREPDPAASRRRMLRAFADVCLAIEFAHSRGVIHRDLKPANIMLGDFGEVYVLDWGIARATAVDAGRPAATGDYDPTASGQTQAGTILGTPAYMAPEQLAGERAGPAADIYALGAVLYEIAAGVTLHPATRGVADAYRAVETRPSASGHWPECPPEIDAICERACALDPGERFASARALHIAIQAFLEGDRDVAARAELARHHVALARAARASGDGEAARQAAMRAAGRALALDPTATEAADVVTELMLAPPRTIPRAVHDRMEAIDVETGRAQGRMGAIAISGYLGFVPLLMWTGVRDVGLVIAFAIAALVSSLQIYWMTRSDKIPTASIYLSAAINAVLIGVVCRIVGPFIIAPTLVVTMLMAYAVHPRFGAMPIVAALLAAGVAIPWALELAGVVAPTYQFVGGTIVLTSPAIAFTSVPVQLAFAVMLVLLVAIVAVLLRTMAMRQHDATRQIELQAWHLRQVVPTTPGR
jgi:eukaryotic-like serine/threonine-protein kinase